MIPDPTEPRTPDGTDEGALAVIIEEAAGGGWKPDDGTSLWFYNAAGDQLQLTGDDAALLLNHVARRASTGADAPLPLDVERLASLWREEEVTDLDVDCPGVDYEATAAAVVARLRADASE